MTNEEYRRLLSQIFDEHTVGHIDGIEGLWYGQTTGAERPWMPERFSKLMRAVVLARFINSYRYRWGSYESRGILRPEAVHHACSTVADCVMWAVDLARVSGMRHALDASYGQIVEGLHVALALERECGFLAELGFGGTQSFFPGESYLQWVMDAVKNSGQRVWVPERGTSLSREMENTAKMLSQNLKEMTRTDWDWVMCHGDESGRGFEGLNWIGEGALLSIAGVGIAAELPPFPVSIEVRPWASLMFAATGVGMMLNGVAVLRGEEDAARLPPIWREMC